MKRNAGFTLIELVIVIIVLGILAATAVPKFINLQDDAKASAMKGVEASLHSAANIVFSKAAINGTEKKAAGSGNKVNDILVAYGFPTAASGGIDNAVELSGFKVGGVTANPSANNIAIWADGASASGDLCILYKDVKTSSATDTYSVTTTKFSADNTCGNG
jgi:MSHA pilin protein MshA